MNIRKAGQFGINATIDSIDWMAIRDRIRARITDTSESGNRDRCESADVSVFSGSARFVGPRELAIDGGLRIGADQIVLATGGRPSVPKIVVQVGDHLPHIGHDHVDRRAPFDHGDSWWRIHCRRTCPRVFESRRCYSDRYHSRALLDTLDADISGSLRLRLQSDGTSISIALSPGCEPTMGESWSTSMAVLSCPPTALGRDR